VVVFKELSTRAGLHMLAVVTGGGDRPTVAEA
jgi:hypothetical protein